MLKPLALTRPLPPYTNTTEHYKMISWDQNGNGYLSDFLSKNLLDKIMNINDRRWIDTFEKGFIYFTQMERKRPTKLVWQEYYPFSSNIKSTRPVFYTSSRKLLHLYSQYLTSLDIPVILPS